MSQFVTHKSTYRPEIEGLKSIAVISALFFHAHITFSGTYLTGGYLGVDVFFVLSGYLIGGNIFNALRGGNFSFADFFERRARRLLPTLFLVLAATSLASLLFLNPPEMLAFASSVLHSIFLGSNVYFASDYLTYWNWAYPRPMLHTWSVSLEEQFYTFLSVMMFVIYKWNKNFLMPALILVSLISIIFAHYFSNGNTDNKLFTYFMLPARMWELLAGTMLALLEVKRGRQNNNPVLAATLPLVGLVVLFLCFFWFNPDTPHPAFWGLIPVGSVMLFLWFGGGKDIATWLLTTKPFVSFGLMTYSIYLWHFPVIVFGRMFAIVPDNWDKAMWSAVSLALAIITYFLVEEPFRNRKKISRKTFLWFTTTFAAGILLFVFVARQDGLKERIPEQYRNVNGGGILRREKFYTSHYQGKEKVVWENKFFTIHPQHQKTLLIVGDSIATALIYSLIPYTKANGYRLRRMSRPSQGLGRENNVKFRAKRTKQLLQLKNSTILLSGLITHPKFTPQQNKSIARAHKKLIPKMLANGNKIIFLYPNPFDWERADTRRKLRIDYSLRGIPSPHYWNPYTRFVKETKKGFELLDSFQHPNIIRIYPHRVMCVKSKNQCNFVKDDIVYIYDRVHFSVFVADLISSEIFLRLKGNPPSKEFQER